MVNAILDGQKYTLALAGGTRTVGKDQLRRMVVAELWEDGFLIATACSMCHPVDKFDLRKGAHLAVNKLNSYQVFSKEAMRELHKKVDSWVSK